MGYDDVTLYNHTTGDLVDNDEWTKAHVEKSDINQLAHMFFWGREDKLRSFRDDGYYHQHTYSAEADKIVTKFLGKVNESADFKTTRQICYESNDFDNTGKICVTTGSDGKKHKSKEEVRGSPNHYPSWTDLGNRKVCSRCLNERSEETVVLVQRDKPCYSFSSNPLVTRHNLEAMLASDPPVIVRGLGAARKPITDRLERQHYLTIAAFDHLLDQYRNNRSTTHPSPVRLFSEYVNKYATDESGKLHQDLLNELTAWLGGGDNASTQTWLSAATAIAAIKDGLTPPNQAVIS